MFEFHENETFYISKTFMLFENFIYFEKQKCYPQKCGCEERLYRSSYKGRMANALASGVEEGRDKLRKAWGRRT